MNISRFVCNYRYKVSVLLQVIGLKSKFTDFLKLFFWGVGGGVGGLYK